MIKIKNSRTMQGQQQQIAQHSAVVPPASSPTLEEDFPSGGGGGDGVRVVLAARRSCRLLEAAGDERITIWPAIGERKWWEMANLASGE